MSMMNENDNKKIIEETIEKKFNQLLEEIPNIKRNITKDIQIEKDFYGRESWEDYEAIKKWAEDNDCEEDGKKIIDALEMRLKAPQKTEEMLIKAKTLAENDNYTKTFEYYLMEAEND